MEFELDSDQEQLRDSLRRLLLADASFERRRAAVASDIGWSRDLWRSMAELGLNALVLPEACGGYGLPPVAWHPVMQELGRTLAIQPFLPSTVVAATALALAGTSEQQRGLLPTGRVLTLAHDEPAARHGSWWVETTAEQAGAGWRLHGFKQNVLFGDDADTLLVSARTGGAADDPQGLMLFLVRPEQAGVRRHRSRLVDDTPAADIEFQGAVAEPVGDGTRGSSALQAALDAGLAATCTETLGLAERACELTREYVQTRQQFGRPIGANQAVRHRVAEMHVALEMVRSAALAGLLALEMDLGEHRSRELSRAKLLASRHGTFVCQQAIQLHGGIGMTTEYPVGHFLRRLMVLEQLHGDGPAHAARLGASLATDIG